MTYEDIFKADNYDDALELAIELYGDEVWNPDDYYGQSFAENLKDYFNGTLPKDAYNEPEADPKVSDVNGDKDDDTIIIDTNNNGERDTAFITAQSPKEEKEAIKKAEKDLMSTGNHKTDSADKLLDNALSMNIVNALEDLRF